MFRVTRKGHVIKSHTKKSVIYGYKSSDTDMKKLPFDTA